MIVMIYNLIIVICERRIVINVDFNFIPLPLLKKIASNQTKLTGTKIEKFILLHK